MPCFSAPAPRWRRKTSAGFLEQLFGNSDRAQEGAPADPSERGNANAGRLAQSSDLAVRLDRLEAHIRQLTGAIEQLQYRNQQLEGQLRRMQQDAEYRVPEGPPRGTPPARPGVPVQPMQPQATQPQATPGETAGDTALFAFAAAAAPGPRRGDAFDPSLNPNAPGAPRPLGTTAPSAPLAQSTDPEEPVGAPGGRTLVRRSIFRHSQGSREMPRRRLRRAIPAAIPAAPPVARRLRRCRPLTARRILTILPTATSCAGNMRSPRILSAHSCAGSRTIGSPRTRNTGWAKVCSSASAIATRRSSSSMSRPNSKPPPRRPTRCCGSVSRSRGSAKRTRPVRRSPRSGANIRAHRSA